MDRGQVSGLDQRHSRGQIGRGSRRLTELGAKNPRPHGGLPPCGVAPREKCHPLLVQPGRLGLAAGAIQCGRGRHDAQRPHDRIAGIDLAGEPGVFHAPHGPAACDGAVGWRAGRARREVAGHGEQEALSLELGIVCGKLDAPAGDGQNAPVRYEPVTHEFPPCGQLDPRIARCPGSPHNPPQQRPDDGRITPLVAGRQGEQGQCAGQLDYRCRSGLRQQPAGQRGA